MEPLLEIELDGVTLKGTPSSLKDLLEKMGHPIEHYFYNSSSKGLIPIKEMNEQHILNAMFKHIKDKIDAFKEIDKESQYYYLNFIHKAGEPVSSGLAKELIARLVNSKEEETLQVTAPQETNGKKTTYSYH